jgi:hypothetical protein
MVPRGMEIKQQERLAIKSTDMRHRAAAPILPPDRSPGRVAAGTKKTSDRGRSEGYKIGRRCEEKTGRRVHPARVVADADSENGWPSGGRTPRCIEAADPGDCDSGFCAPVDPGALSAHDARRGNLGPVLTVGLNSLSAFLGGRRMRRPCGLPAGPAAMIALVGDWSGLKTHNPQAPPLGSAGKHGWLDLLWRQPATTRSSSESRSLAGHWQLPSTRGACGFVAMPFLSIVARLHCVSVTQGSSRNARQIWRRAES